MGRGSASRDVREVVRSADVVLLVGSRTNENGTDAWRVSPGRDLHPHRVIGRVTTPAGTWRTTAVLWLMVTAGLALAALFPHSLLLVAAVAGLSALPVALTVVAVLPVAGTVVSVVVRPGSTVVTPRRPR